MTLKAYIATCELETVFIADDQENMRSVKGRVIRKYLEDAFKELHEIDVDVQPLEKAATNYSNEDLVYSELGINITLQEAREITLGRMVYDSTKKRLVMNQDHISEKMSRKTPLLFYGVENVKST